jgi:hypothetical protein
VWWLSARRCRREGGETVPGGEYYCGNEVGKFATGTTTGKEKMANDCAIIIKS